MRSKFSCLFAAIPLAMLIGCSHASKEEADRQADRAKEKTRAGAERLRTDAQKLGREAKQEAHSLGQNIDHALKGTGPAQSGTTGQAEEKLRRGGEDLRAAGSQAAVKLDRAAIVAKVKAKLASNVGFSSITGIDVDAAGGTVTLRGTVASQQQKEQAEQAVLAVNGVSKVVNELTVKP